MTIGWCINVLFSKIYNEFLLLILLLCKSLYLLILLESVVFFKCLFEQTSPESPGIYLLLQKLFRSQTVEDLQDAAKLADLSDEEFKVVSLPNEFETKPMYL